MLTRSEADRAKLIGRLTQRGDAAWLADLRERFGDRVLPISEEIAEAWGLLRVDGPLPVVDGLQAATALVHGLVVVSRDTTTAERVGVSWLDPWSG